MRRTRAEMYRAIDADYYGFRDEEDGILEKVGQRWRCVGSIGGLRTTGWKQSNVQAELAVEAC